MSRFWPEPEYKHGTPARTAVMLVNLGTPEAPTKAALRTYLKEFLSDPRVVEIPRPVWWPILNGVILNTRPGHSAQKYARIWTANGSPLKVHTALQAKLLRGFLGHGGNPEVVVAWAMRYGNPSIAETLQQLKRDNCTRILVLPLYPQYAASTTASVFDEVARCMRNWRNVPELRFVRGFADDPDYIAALDATVREHWMHHGKPDKLIMSFHGVPRFALTMGDPYHCECQKTARLLAERLGLAPGQYDVTFQSRFGRAEWLQPYTQPTLERYAREGVRRVAVICPGFVADCLETLEEIAIECKTAFLRAGGTEYLFIAGLNERDDWISALASLARAHMWDWLELREPDGKELMRCRERALALGATT